MRPRSMAAWSGSPWPAHEQEPKPVSDQIHRVLNLEELATIVLALRAAELHGFADRLNTLAQRIEPPTEK